MENIANVEMWKIIATILGIMASLFGGIWFLLVRAGVWGASNKHLNILTDTVNKLAEEMRDGFHKMDIKNDSLRTELKGDMQSLRTELKGDMSELKKDLGTRMDRMEDQMKEMESDQKSMIKDIAAIKNNESKLDRMEDQMKEMESNQKSMIKDIAAIKNNESKLDRLEDQMKEMKLDQKNIVNDIVAIKNNESKLILSLARWIFSKNAKMSKEKEFEEVDFENFNV